MLRLEAFLFAVFCALWAVATLVALGFLPVKGLLSLDLYTLYGIAAFLGWLSGNIYIARRRRLKEGRETGRILLVLYLVGSPAIVYFLRVLAPEAWQQGAPFVPLYALGVQTVFFLVPVTLSATRTPPRTPRIGG